MVKVVCPYCGLDNWAVVQFQARRGVEGFIALCRCNNCNKIFYINKGRLHTRTYRLEDIEHQ